VTGRGELERSVIDALWNSGHPITAREVGQALPGRPLAITTVLTVLGRLQAKGLVRRTRQGRAHAYEPTASREEHTAALMRQVLDGAGDRGDALARFVGTVTDQDIQALRRAIGDR